MTRLRLGLIGFLGATCATGCSTAGGTRADRPLVQAYAPGLEQRWDGELPIVAKATPGANAEVTTKRIAAAVDSYEGWFWRRTGVTSVVLCSDLTVGGEPVSAARVQLKRGLETERMLLLNVPEEAVPAWYVERIMHHELFHVFEETVWPGTHDVWDILFEDYAGEAVLRRWVWRREGFIDILRIEKAPEEFVSIYGQVSGEEDRAEVFSMLMVFPEAVEAKAASDTRLNLKLFTIKTMLEIAEQQEGYPAGQVGSGSGAR